MIILKLIVLAALAYSIYTLFSNLKHKGLWCSCGVHPGVLRFAI